jgi:cation-transporting P-type ATPase I
MVARAFRRTVATTVSAVTLPARLAGQALPSDPAVSGARPTDRDEAGSRGGPVTEGPVAGVDAAPEEDAPFLEIDDLVELLEDGVERVEDVVGRVEDVVDDGVHLFEDTLGLHRRVWEDEDHDRAQIEVHGIEDPSAVGFRRRLAQALGRLDDVRWAEVNAITGRVAVAFDGGESTLASLVELIEGLEETFGAPRRPERPAWDVEERADHPADDEPIHRVIAIMTGEVLSLGWTAVGRATRMPRLPAEVPGIISVVDNNPWLRMYAQRVLGRRVAALAIPLLGAAASGVAQGPMGTLVDLGMQAASLGELRARRRAWDRQEPLFYAVHSDDPIDPPDLPPRPGPELIGPVERWAARVGQLGAGVAGASYLATRDLRGSADLLVATTPKAARAGREGFAALLGRTLAYRGIVPLDGSALRRLDRIDTVVLDAEVLVAEQLHLRRAVTPAGDEVDERIWAAAERLFDPTAPSSTRRRKPWRLGPADEVDHATLKRARGALSRIREVRRTGSVPLALQRDGEVIALVEIAPQLDPGATAVVDAVRACGHRLLIAEQDDRVTRALEADGRVSPGDPLGDEVRELQAQGHGVMVIGRQGHRGLAAADVALGVLSPTGRPSWGADLILGRELADAATIVTATRIAREVSERSVRLAMGGTALGTLVTTTGPRLGAASRALAMVNGAAGAALVSGAWSAVQLSHDPRPRPPDRTRWHDMVAERVVAALDSDARSGLTAADAAQRRHVVTGSGDEVGPLEPFLAELANPLNPVLGAGAGLSAASGSMSDAALVLGLIGVNTLVGGVQRLRADRTVRRLLSHDVEAVTVIREGRELVIGEDRLVQGDVLVLRAGDPVPADARVLHVDGCEVDESSLTGESLPATKTPDPAPDSDVADRSCMLYEDTTVVAGSARAVVVAVGEHTEVARSLALTGPPPPTGVEIRLEELTRRLLPAALGVAGLTAGVGLLRRWPLTDVTGTAVSLAIASVPEGLPFVATAGQLAGARRLAARGAVVRNPRTVEALGRVDVLCVDKTGTLTEGRVGVVGVSDGREQQPMSALAPSARRTLVAALRASDQPGDDGRALHELNEADQALHAAVERLGLDAAEEHGRWDVVDDLPFEASRGFHATLGRNGRAGDADDPHRLLVKGAPEVLLELCDTWAPGDVEVTLDAGSRAELEAHVDALARQGHRLLAVADRPASSDPSVDERRVERLCLRGLIVLADPVRETAAAAVHGIGEAGVRTIMVTGDHPETASEIARQLGLDGGGHVLTGADLADLDDEELARRLERVRVVARVAPADKLRIVTALQAAGRVVAMTGDGANDAAAIRVAEVGVALGERSSGAAREAADIVVTDDRVETLIDAIAEGRALWGSIREALAVLVGGNLGEIGFTTIASAVSPSAPLHPRQFLLVNLFTDLAPAVAIAVRPPTDVSPETLLREGPDASLGDALRRDIAIRGTATALGASAAYGAARLTGTQARAGSVGLAALVGTQLGQTVVAGGWRQPATLLTAAGSAAALVAAIQTPVVSRFFGSRPLGPLGWSQAIVASVAATLGSEVASRVAVRLDELHHERLAEAGDTDAAPLLRRRRTPAIGPGDGPTRVLVAGAGGFVGRSVVPRLLDEGHEVVCLVRDPERVPEDWSDAVTVVQGDAGDVQAVLRAAQDCAAAYYLVDTLADGLGGLLERERAVASAFADGVDLAGVGRVVYLGRLVDEEELGRVSEHTYARHQVGEALREGPVPVTEVRAGPVLGAGGTTFELLHAAARARIDLTAPLGGARIQPVALADLLEVLVAVLTDPETDGRTLEVGGPDVTSYPELVELLRSHVGPRRTWRAAPASLPAETVSLTAAPAAGVAVPVATALLQATRDRGVVRDEQARRRFEASLRTSAEAAVAAAVGSTG